MEIYDEFGNSQLLQQKKTAFLCSRQVPQEHHATILDWAQQLSPESCVISGMQSPLERQVGNILLQRGIPVIWVALNLQEVKSKMPSLQSFVLEKRILILVLFDDTCPLSKEQQSYMRNMSVIEYANDVVVGYCNQDGNLSRQLSGCQSYTQLISPNNHRYVDFIHLPDGFISLDTLQTGDQQTLQLTQHRKSEQYLRKDVITIPASEVIRLRNMLDKAIEANHWGESRYNEIRKTYPNAYRTWSPDETLILRELSQQGMTDNEIAKILGRQPSAIASRLQKIIDDESSHQPA